MRRCRVGLYLWGRGLSGEVPAELSLAEGLECWEEGARVGTLPAMVAAVRDPAGALVAYHRTFLDPRPGRVGKASAELGVTAPKKLTPTAKDGETMGAAVRLAPAGPVLGVAEGIETALAAQEATGVPAWAAISAEGLRRFTWPDGVGRLVIWADHDRTGTGEKAARALSSRALAAGLSVRVCLPALPGWDWLDVLNARGPEALRAALEPPAPEVPDLTELASARLLAERHGFDLAHDFGGGRWWTWSGVSWVADTTGAVERLAHGLVHLYLERADKLTAQAAAVRNDPTKDPDAAEEEAERIAGRAAKAREWGTALCSERRIKAVVRLGCVQEGIPADPGAWDPDPWALCVENGVLDLKTGFLRPHRRRDRLTKCAPVVYDPEATAPTWAACLEAWTGKDEGLTRYLQTIAGYSATGDVREDCLFVHYGPKGRNGKGVFLGTLSRLLGSYALETSPETFLLRDKPTGGATPELAELQGARLVTASEVEHGQRLSEGLVKRITGRDVIRARFLYQRAPVAFFPSFKVHIRSNYRPRVSGTDPAIWSRIRLVPWMQTFRGREDRGLADRLWEERSGILNWVLAGVAAWQLHGMGSPPAVEEATDQYRQDSDTLGTWIAEECEVGPRYRAPVADLYPHYNRWTEEAGLRSFSRLRFNQDLAERGFTQKSDGRMRFWEGLALKVVRLSEIKVPAVSSNRSK